MRIVRAKKDATASSPARPSVDSFEARPIMGRKQQSPEVPSSEIVRRARPEINSVSKRKLPEIELL